MTFAEKLAHASAEDPDFARSVKRMRVASWVFGIGVALAIGIGIWSVAVNYEQETQITRIESPCIRHGAKSEQCREAFEAAVATITHPQACAIQRKAGTLRAVRELAADLKATFSEPCAGARIAQERQRAGEREATRRLRSPGGSAGRQPAPSAPQPFEPRGNPDGEDEGKPKPDKESPSQPRRPNDAAESPSTGTTRPPPAPAPQSSSAPAPEPDPSPGNSGETPATEKGNGEQLCVELVVSACVDRDVPLVP